MTGPPPTELSDGELVRRARDGSRAAMETLFRRHAQMVHGLAFRLLARPGEAEEVAQDALASAFVGLDRLREPDGFRYWLRGICVKKCRSRIRNLQVRRRIGLVDHAGADLAAFASDDLPPDSRAELRMLSAHLERLPVEERMTLLLVRVEGMTLPEAAEHLGRGLATVKRRLAKADERLRKYRGSS